MYLEELNNLGNGSCVHDMRTRPKFIKNNAGPEGIVSPTIKVHPSTSYGIGFEPKSLVYFPFPHEINTETRIKFKCTCRLPYYRSVNRFYLFYLPNIHLIYMMSGRITFYCRDAQSNSIEITWLNLPYSSYYTLNVEFECTLKSSGHELSDYSLKINGQTKTISDSRFPEQLSGVISEPDKLLSFYSSLLTSGHTYYMKDIELYINDELVIDADMLDKQINNYTWSHSYDSTTSNITVKIDKSGWLYNAGSTNYYNFYLPHETDKLTVSFWMAILGPRTNSWQYLLQIYNQAEDNQTQEAKSNQIYLRRYYTFADFIQFDTVYRYLYSADWILPQDDDIHHYVIRYDSTKMDIYIDSVLVYTLELAERDIIFKEKMSLSFGSNGSYYVPLKYKDALVFDYHLSDEQIKFLYNSQAFEYGLNNWNETTGKFERI